jgi:hypothetical protein
VRIVHDAGEIAHRLMRVHAQQQRDLISHRSPAVR